MTFLGTVGYRPTIQVDGAPIDPLVENRLIAVEIDTNLYLPSQCRLTFRGSAIQVVEPGGFMMAAEVTVQITSGVPPVPEQIFVGEVTAVDLEIGPEGAMVVVRAADRSHRLMHGTVTMAYPEMTASDVVEAIVAEAEVVPGIIEPTTNIYDWLSSPNLSPWTFIQQLALRENKVAYADSLGVFNFKAMPAPETAPVPMMSAEMPRESAKQLAVGVNLIRLRVSATGAEQVPEVTVTGYDPSESMPVVGPFASLPSTALPLDPGLIPAAVSGEFAAKPFFDARIPVDSEGQATTLAESIANDLAGSVVEIEGQCLGEPSITAGTPISIGLAGAPFDGQYVCTSARHVFEPGNGGYTTWFTVGGRRDRTLLSLAGGPAHDGANQGRLPGLVIGMVTNNMDPEDLGRVKVLFPWLSAEYESAWARVVQIGAGKAGNGWSWMPEVGDEVLVGFDRGDIDHPFVIGNLYNGIARPEPAPSVQEVVASRRITSRALHTIQFDDGPEAMAITIRTGTETVSIKLDQEEQALTITSAGKITVQAGAEGISFQSGGSIQFEAAESFQVTAGQGATVEAGGSISMQSGEGVSVESTSVALTAPEITLGA